MEKDSDKALDEILESETYFSSKFSYFWNVQNIYATFEFIIQVRFERILPAILNNYIIMAFFAHHAQHFDDSSNLYFAKSEYNWSEVLASSRASRVWEHGRPMREGRYSGRNKSVDSVVLSMCRENGTSGGPIIWMLWLWWTLSRFLHHTATYTSK